jgi:hypothetical protein
MTGSLRKRKPNNNDGLSAVNGLDQVKAKFGFDRTLDNQDFFFEDNVIEGFDHLTTLKFPQVTTAFGRRAGREFFCQFAKIGAFGQLLLYLFGLFFGFYQNMASAGGFCGLMHQ